VEHLKATIDRIRRSGKIVGTKTLMVLGAWSQEPSLHSDPRA
jgi:hypothetical protein